MIKRYTLPEMGAIWTEENKFRKWLDVEIAACQANAEAGNIPSGVVDVIRRKAALSPSPPTWPKTSAPKRAGCITA
jgi:adenylosuccinate lyase